MAEISGPSGPSTAPRRRCCPAWPWTATAWARPPPDACPPRACQVPRRPGNTWPVSTFTRTRVSVAHCASTHPPALMGILGREPRSNLGGWSWASLSGFTRVCRRLAQLLAQRSVSRKTDLSLVYQIVSVLLRLKCLQSQPLWGIPVRGLVPWAAQGRSRGTGGTEPSLGHRAPEDRESGTCRSAWWRLRKPVPPPRLLLTSTLGLRRTLQLFL